MTATPWVGQFASARPPGIMEIIAAAANSEIPLLHLSRITDPPLKNRITGVHRFHLIHLDARLRASIIARLEMGRKSSDHVSRRNLPKAHRLPDDQVEV